MQLECESTRKYLEKKITSYLNKFNKKHKKQADGYYELSTFTSQFKPSSMAVNLSNVNDVNNKNIPEKERVLDEIFPDKKSKIIKDKYFALIDLEKHFDKNVPGIEQIRGFQAEYNLYQRLFAGTKPDKKIKHILLSLATLGFYALVRSTYSLATRNTHAFWKSRSKLLGEKSKNAKDKLDNYEANYKPKISKS